MIDEGRCRVGAWLSGIVGGCRVKDCRVSRRPRKGGGEPGERGEDGVVRDGVVREIRNSRSYRRLSCVGEPGERGEDGVAYAGHDEVHYPSRLQRLPLAAPRPHQPNPFAPLRGTCRRPAIIATSAQARAGAHGSAPTPMALVMTRPPPHARLPGHWPAARLSGHLLKPVCASQETSDARAAVGAAARASGALGAAAREAAMTGVGNPSLKYRSIKYPTLKISDSKIKIRTKKSDSKISESQISECALTGGTSRRRRAC